MALGLGGCGTGRARSVHSSSVSPPASFGATVVLVQLRGPGPVYEPFRAELEAALGRSYRRSGETAFRRIQLILEKAEVDPVNSRDLLVTGTLVIVTHRGTEHRRLERRLRDAARRSPRDWAREAAQGFMPVIDYQLRLLR
jgi:hypothetical protein